MTATSALCKFVLHRAKETQERIGFGWVASPHAPETYEGLQEEFAWCTKTGNKMAISNAACEDTIFESAHVNMAFRFWHDTEHIRWGSDFTLPQEWKLVSYHLESMREYGFNKTSLPYQMLSADLYGQLTLLGITGKYPTNQGRFSRQALQQGIPAAVQAEITRINEKS